MRGGTFVWLDPRVLAHVPHQLVRPDEPRIASCFRAHKRLLAGVT